MRLIDAEDVKKRADCYPPQIRNVVANILRHTKTVKPEQDEWCTDCKEYDSEKHCCPRFNRVIRNTLRDAQPVIRCKDCKHFGGGTYCYERDDMWDENDFCSYAERRGEEDEDE